MITIDQFGDMFQFFIVLEGPLASPVWACLRLGLVCPTGHCPGPPGPARSGLAMGMRWEGAQAWADAGEGAQRRGMSVDAEHVEAGGGCPSVRRMDLSWSKTVLP